jgi:hypothetical protein
VSLRFLYRKIPVAKRICSYYRCQRPIIRNIARAQDGRLYHYGCLQSARDEVYECLECYLHFDGTEAGFVDAQKFRGDMMQEGFRPACPNCGSSNLKTLGGALN